MKTAFSMVISAVCFTATVLYAGEAAPDKTEKTEKPVVQPGTWRPFKDQPDVLFFESFEHPNSYIDEKDNKCAVVSEDPLPPGGHGLKLMPNAVLKLSQTQLRMPQGLNPAQIWIQFSVYADDPGKITVKFDHPKGSYSHGMNFPKAKSWGVITMKLSDARDKALHAEIDQTISTMTLTVEKPQKRDAPKVYIDDLLITYNVPPADIKPRVMVAEKKRIDMQKFTDRDGYSYSSGLNEFLKADVKPFKGKIKTKNVVVMGASSEDTQAWVKSLAAAAPKLKDSSYVFQPADDPEAGSNPIGGLADMRTLLTYNLANAPEFALLAVGPEEELTSSQSSGSVRAVIERALALGTIPVVVFPPVAKGEVVEKEKGKMRNREKNKDSGDKLAAFVRATTEQCAQWGVPVVDSSFALKGAKGEIDPKSPEGAEKIALLAMSLIKHCHDSLAKD